MAERALTPISYNYRSIALSQMVRAEEREKHHEYREMNADEALQTFTEAKELSEKVKLVKWLRPKILEQMINRWEYQTSETAWVEFVESVQDTKYEEDVQTASMNMNNYRQKDLWDSPSDSDEDFDDCPLDSDPQRDKESWRAACISVWNQMSTCHRKHLDKESSLMIMRAGLEWALDKGGEALRGAPRNLSTDLWADFLKAEDEKRAKEIVQKKAE